MGFFPRQQSFPEGWAFGDHLWWGRNGLNPSTILARGARVDVPDLRTADNRTILDLRRQNHFLLQMLGMNDALQIHWTVEDDFFGDLSAFDQKTERLEKEGKMRRFCKTMRSARTNFYRAQLKQGQRRREVLHFYLCTQGGPTSLSQLRAPSLAQGEAYLKAQTRAVDQKLQQMQSEYSLGKFHVLDAQGMTQHGRRMLNPGLALEMAEDPRCFGTPVDERRSLRANWLRGDVAMFNFGDPAKSGLSRPVGLQWQNTFHALFIIERSPTRTRPGMWSTVFNAVDRQCAITQTIIRMETNTEVARIREEILELSKYLNDEKSLGVGKEVQDKKTRLDSLLDGMTIPFSVMTVVRVWGKDLDDLSARALAVRSALARMDGCEFHEVNDRQRARNIFLSCLPGNAQYAFENRGQRNTWLRYMENHNLVDWLPVSATFTGHLGADAQVLLDSPGGGVVGVRFLAQGTPQHTTVTGVTGAGKTVLMIEALAQMEAEISYLYIQEEGMAFAPYALVRGIPSLVMRESSEFTINPFDTFGLPMTSGNIATVAKVAMKLIGLSKDGDRNSRRENLISEYVAALYKDTAETIKQNDEERWFDLSRRAMLAEGMRRANDDFLDGFTALRELERVNPGLVEERRAQLSEAAVIAYQTNPRTRDIIANLVFTTLKPDEYPVWSSLCSMIKSARFTHHKTGAIADELNQLVSDMARGRSSGGAIGPLIDGPTNVNLHGAGLHFDTSYLSDGILKNIAGFLFPEMVRKHIIGLPRSQFKVMVLDEMRRIALIPGAVEHIKEMLAQLRKYKTCMIGGFQGPSQIDEIDPALTTLLFGQCKQHFLMRQNDASELKRIAEAIGLPQAAQRAIASHTLIEHQQGPVRRTYFTFFSRDAAAPTCGTVTVQSHPQLVWLASSNGDVFDRKNAVLKSYPDPVDGIIEELALLQKAKEKEKPTPQRLVTV